jgi:predicted PurR-regulated permease PerM
LSIGLILLFLGGFLAAIVPPLAKQTTNFIQGVPALVEDTRNGNGPIGHFVKTYNLESQVDKLSAQLSSRVGDIGGSALSTVTKIGSSVFATLTVIVLTIMMLTEGPRWRAVFVELIPVHRRKHVAKLSHDMNRVIQGYVNGQVTLAAIAAVLILPALFIAGASYPLALMVIVFICGLIPMVGHTIGAIIVTTVALFTSVPAAIIVLSYYILYQQIENYVVQPRIQANSTNMSPLLVFIAVILGVNFGGLLGGLVAIPVMGCARILLLDYLEQRNILSTKTVRDAKTQGGSI